MLHLIFTTAIDENLCARFSAGDALAFLENSVLILLKQGKLQPLMTRLQSQHNVYVLGNDLNARGIHHTELVSGIHIIDYPQLVQLSLTHSLIQSWT